MPLKSAQEYVASLRDGRVVYWDGVRVDDVTCHPKFKPSIAVAARDYEYGDPARRELLTYEAEGGAIAHRIFQVPRNEADLLKRVELMKSVSIVGGTTAVLMALIASKDELAAVNPKYAENVERVYRHVRDNDLRAAEVVTDPKGDRTRRASDQDDPDLYLRIVERRDDGIVVRGAKLHITGASLVHELVVMPTKGMRPEEADYAVSFAIPVNTPGVKIINRAVVAPDLNAFDFPGSAHHEGAPEGFVIFDDVFVPWDRVFLAGETKLAGLLAMSLGLWERTAGLIGSSETADIFVGLAQLVSEMQGKERDPSVQTAIAELINYAEIIRMSLDFACRHYQTTKSGMVYPNELAVNAGKYFYASNFHAAVKQLHDVSGGLVITQPSEADLRGAETGPYIRKYLYTKKDVDVEARMRIINLIRDKTADALGGWHMVVAMQAGGNLLAQRVMMSRGFDMKKAKRAALKAAGVEA